MDTIIPESTEQEVSVEQENATFFVLGDAAYTSEIIEEYNRNAENKTNEFNSNSDAKVKEYNTNATNKTTAFDNNYDTKVAAFNKNAETQTETFNSNAITKENSFNANATTSVQNYNANAEQKLYEFNANALAYEEGITDNSNRVKRLEMDIFDSGTASGSLVKIQDSTLAEFQELTVDGVSKQITTTGKNQLPYPYVNKTKNLNGITFTDNGDGTITVNGTATANASFALLGSASTDANVEFPNAKFISGGYSTGLVIRAIHNDGTTYHSLCVDKGNGALIDTTTYNSGYIEIVVYSGITCNNIVIKPMLSESGGEWEPYTGGQPSPSPDYPQTIDVIDEGFEIESCGKNLLDLSNMIKTTTINGITFTNNENGTFNVNGTATEDTSIAILSNILFNNLKSGKGYELYSNIPYNANTFNVSFNLYTEGETKFIVGNNVVHKYTWEKIISNKLNLYIPKGQTVNATNVELALYETDTAINNFEPYQGTVSTITLPDGEFAADGDLFRIAFNNEDGKYHLWLDKNIGKVVLDGSESWSKSGGATDTIFVGAISILNLGMMDGAKNSICTHFTYSNPTIENTYQIYNSGANLCLRFNINDIPDVAALKTWLSENNVTIYYQLTEPYSLDLRAIDMPLTYYPTTNVFTTHDLQPLINVMYYRDIKNTITTMQTDIETLKEAVATLTFSQTNLASEVDLLQEQTETESEVIE